MKLDVSVDLAYPRERIFETYRDKLPDLLPYLPNVRGIEVVSRKEEAGKVVLLNHWKGGGDIPAVARSFLSEKLLEWDDHATWDPQAFVCHWRTVVPSFKEALRAEGQNLFQDAGGGKCRFTVQGVIEVDAKKVPGVPRLMAGVVGPAVETFLVSTIKPNLVSVAKGIEKYLAANP